MRAPGSIEHVGIVGGGTAGYFAALAIKKHFPDLRVTLVESSAIPIIGVGEATTTTMPPFLHLQLGLDIVELYRDVRPTWKLGIKFEWGLPGDYYFTYPFGDVDAVSAYAHDGDIRRQNLASQLLAMDRSPILRDPSGHLRSLMPELKFAYHLHNAPFVAYLAKAAVRAGVSRIDAIIDDVVLLPDGSGIERLRTRDGRELRFDLYVDATGFRSRLMGTSLGSPFLSYASSLFCDTAVVADVPQPGGVIKPYTLAETMDNGWCWTIPVDGVDHRGYVYSSTFATEAQAIAEMRAKNPDMGDTWTVRFRSGRHADFWKGNVVAIGNAYGFVEPLESTALHMIIIELAYILGMLRVETRDDARLAHVNRRVGAHWDFLRWFLAIHYKFNHRLDTPFWRACRHDVDVSGVAPVIARYRTEGAWAGPLDLDCVVADPTFGSGEALLILLLGQKVEAPPVRPRLPPACWAARIASQQAVVAQAVPQAEALAILRERPDLLYEFVQSPSSWCHSDGDPDVTLSAAIG